MLMVIEPLKLHLQSHGVYQSCRERRISKGGFFLYPYLMLQPWSSIVTKILETLKCFILSNSFIYHLLLLPQRRVCDDEDKRRDKFWCPKSSDGQILWNRNYMLRSVTIESTHLRLGDCLMRNVVVTVWHSETCGGNWKKKRICYLVPTIHHRW